MGTSFVRLWTCKTGLISERLTRDPLGRLWMCKTGSISERLTRDPLGRPWTCKTGSIFECLIRTPLGRLLDMQNWFNIRTSDRDPSWTSSGHAELVQYLNVWQGPLLDIFWTCKTGSISVFLSRSHLGRLWTCKIISISERLTRDLHGCLWMCNTSNSNSHPAPMCALPTALLHVHQWLHIYTDPSVKLEVDRWHHTQLQDCDKSADQQDFEKLAVWCSRNNQELNTLGDDFRRNPPALPPSPSWIALKWQWRHSGFWAPPSLRNLRGTFTLTC